jgi:hypothetical protein
LRLPKVKTLSDDDEQFLMVVDQDGDPPQGRGSGAVDFWKKVQDGWNTAGKMLHYANWRHLKKRYERLQKKLQGLSL